MFNVEISQENKDRENQRYLDDLKRVMKTHSTIPTHEPKKLLDCIWLYKDGATYRLYIYINNEWKYSALT